MPNMSPDDFKKFMQGVKTVSRDWRDNNDRNFNSNKNKRKIYNTKQATLTDVIKGVSDIVEAFTGTTIIENKQKPLYVPEEYKKRYAQENEDEAYDVPEEYKDIEQMEKEAEEGNYDSVENNNTINESREENIGSIVRYNDKTIADKDGKLLLNFDVDNVKMGFVYSEILGPPKCRRRRRR